VLMRKPGVNAAFQYYDQAIKYLEGSEKIKESGVKGGTRYASLRT
jgi:hypothetical protein